jgi:hypothetical protein
MIESSNGSADDNHDGSNSPNIDVSISVVERAMAQIVIQNRRDLYLGFIIHATALAG